ncbi:hypothetical protein Ddye_021680 [Dipteronia dyeriana]|uniref:Expansin n=1 Tax=Dipteronia dyeriana TaxID=168575 RepID=A0AAD9WY85_9ROSI|nr:hypothetical protein Ddye_021680 [Dipteronia dyeriana]
MDIGVISDGLRYDFDNGLSYITQKNKKYRERKRKGEIVVAPLAVVVALAESATQVLVTNVGLDGEVIAVKVKGSKSGWIPIARNWGQNWKCNVNLIGEPLSFVVTTISRRTPTSNNVAPAN